VDQVRLLGDGIATEAVLFNLPAGKSEWLTAKLDVAGALKYEVRQGLNRADMLIVADISKLTSYQRVLTISDGNRYIISGSDTVPLQ
jgi:hypothetical protein